MNVLRLISQLIGIETLRLTKIKRNTYLTKQTSDQCLPHTTNWKFFSLKLKSSKIERKFWGFLRENGQNGPILGEFGDPIEERRNVRNNARFMPPFQGHFEVPYEEPWLGRRQGRQQG